ncbi:MAG: hypothetical protein Q4C87_05330 [Actinomycetaceae bacterium]|nr:hypothetical protein [Actinomycetaceae bacterium]
MQQYSLLEETGHTAVAAHPCRDGRIVALTVQNDYGARPGQSELPPAVPSRKVDFDPQSYVFDVMGGKEFYALEIWDVNTQTMDTIPLVSPDGSAFSYADPEKHFFY